MRISAVTGEGIEELKEVLQRIARSRRVYLERVYSYQEIGLVQKIRKLGAMLSEEYETEGIHVKAYVPPELFVKFMTGDSHSIY